ncbi:MAG: DNA polymerase IV [Cytophagaceae bacterium]
MNRNSLHKNLRADILFIDMNCFFASCEQQANYWLRNRPVGVCVYTGRNGCIISPSIEAKKRGVKTGMRLPEAMQICPELIPLETRPDRYRDFHVKIIQVLKAYSEDVIPKSIDEAVVDLSDYSLIHKDPMEVAKKIKHDIKTNVGDWLQCSIGVAPNAFLAKLGSSLKKPDGLILITPENIDQVLRPLSLLQLPGIARGMAERLQVAGINNPLEMRHSTPERLKAACKSITGLYWYYRLNFSEVDLISHDYKSMQAMRQISADKRKTIASLDEIFLSLCMTLEKRMVKQDVFCKSIGFFSSYENGYSWKTTIQPDQPVQDGMQLMNMIRTRMDSFESAQQSESVINRKMTAISVTVSHFIPSEAVQYSLFENNISKYHLRKVIYSIKDKFGTDKILRAKEMQEGTVKDIIGFGSVKDLHAE